MIEICNLDFSVIYPSIVTVRKKILQMDDVLYVEVEIIVWRILEDCILKNIVKFTNVMVNFLAQDFFIIIDLKHHSVIHQNQYSASPISAFYLITQSYQNEEHENCHLYPFLICRLVEFDT